MSENAYRDLVQKPSDSAIIALDKMNWDTAADVMSEVNGLFPIAKVNSLADVEGWRYTINTLTALGALTMADPKFHDTPETVLDHFRAVAYWGPLFITTHASGGRPMLRAAVEGRDLGLEDRKIHRSHAVSRPIGVLAITVLTSIDEEENISIFGDKPEKKVLQFAKMAQEEGADGLVCSGQELRAIRSDSSLDNMVAVVPGITPPWANLGSGQKRIVTPTEAIQNGADFIVLGRAVTRPPKGISILEAAHRVAQELSEAE